MVSFITKTELRAFASEKSFQDRTAVRKRAETASVSISSFLSHSSKDDDLLVGAILVLEGHGSSVYIDEKDPEMPPYTSEETAALLKSRIRQCKKFVMLASDNSKNSKWVPWELGIADGAKGLNSVALFPASNHSWEQSWAEWEYLGLYQKIVWGRLTGEENSLWLVWNSKANTAVPLSKWLRF